MRRPAIVYNAGLSEAQSGDSIYPYPSMQLFNDPTRLDALVFSLQTLFFFMVNVARQVTRTCSVDSRRTLPGSWNRHREQAGLRAGLSMESLSLVKKSPERNFICRRSTNLKTI